MNKIYIPSIVIAISLLICSCGGTPSQSDNTNTPATSGDVIYKNACISCHLQNGQGMSNMYPPLAKSDFIADKGKTIAVILKGLSGDVTVNGTAFHSVMPAQSLTDNEVAAVLTYVYSNFGNNGGQVTADEVKAARTKM